MQCNLGMEAKYATWACGKHVKHITSMQANWACKLQCQHADMKNIWHVNQSKQRWECMQNVLWFKHATHAIGQVCDIIQGKHATTCKQWIYTNLGSLQLGPKQWPMLRKWGPNAHTSTHANMVHHLGIKRPVLNTHKRDDHGYMASIPNSEIA